MILEYTEYLISLIMDKSDDCASSFLLVMVLVCEKHKKSIMVVSVFLLIPWNMFLNSPIVNSLQQRQPQVHKS